MNTKWSSKEKIIPFLPKDFLPLSPEQQAIREAQEVKLRKAQQQALAASLNVYTESLKKKNAEAKVSPS